MTDCDTSAFWDARFKDEQTPWDIGQAAPPFVTLLESGKLSPGHMIVVGCGSGHDAALFAKAGFEVTGIDFAKEAITLAQHNYGNLAQFIHADLFNLPQSLVGAFDYVLEHTCYCAMSPEKRPAYVTAVASLLKPQGHFIGLFWAHGRDGGPPFSTNETEVRTLFGPLFSVDTFVTPKNSFQHPDILVQMRHNEERLGYFQKKGDPQPLC